MYVYIDIDIDIIYIIIYMTHIPHIYMMGTHILSLGHYNLLLSLLKYLTCTCTIYQFTIGINYSIDTMLCKNR